MPQQTRPVLVMHVLMRSLVSLCASPYTTKPVRCCFDSGARLSLVCRASTNGEMVDKDSYDSRWEGMWVAGIDHGEVRTQHRHMPVEPL